MHTLDSLARLKLNVQSVEKYAIMYIILENWVCIKKISLQNLSFFISALFDGKYAKIGLMIVDI